MIFLFIALLIGKLIIIGLLIDRYRLKKKLDAKLEGPCGYMCANDYNYELGENICKSNVVIYGSLAECIEGMGEIHAEECGIAYIKIIKLKDAKKGKY